jgi:hypothetical protein
MATCHTAYPASGACRNKQTLPQISTTRRYRARQQVRKRAPHHPRVPREAIRPANPIFTLRSPTCVSPRIIPPLLAAGCEGNFTDPLLWIPNLIPQSGNNFFSGWNFFTGSDPTNGVVQYVDQGTAVRVLPFATKSTSHDLSLTPSHSNRAG